MNQKITILAGVVPFFYYKRTLKIRYKLFLKKYRNYKPRPYELLMHLGHYGVSRSLIQGLKSINENVNYNPSRKTYIGPNSVIIAINSIVINTDVSIAEMVVIRDHNHDFAHSDKLLSEQSYASTPIKIESNTRLAAKATILKGVTIGKNSFICAHALVNKSTEKNSTSVGIPAKPILKTKNYAK